MPTDIHNGLPTARRTNHCVMAHREPAPYTAFSIITIAASAGGLPAVETLLAGLPAYLPVPVVVALHRTPATDDQVPKILQRTTRLTVEPVQAGGGLRPGSVYVAPGGHNVLVQTNGRLEVVYSAPNVHGRPSADLLFRSAAIHFGARVLAVVLTGSNSDGAQGAQAIKQAGGRVLAQSPRLSFAPLMPSAAIDTGCVDFVLPIDRLAHAIVSLVMMPGVSSYLAVAPPAWAAH